MPNWLDANPGAYWQMVILVIAVTLFFILRSFFRQPAEDKKETDWWWSLAIAGLLFAGRWPTWFISTQLNVDESQLVTGARSLRFDPVFWRSVDGGTAGPLDFYALLPAGTLLGGDSYLSARITAFLLVGLALIFVYQTLAIVFGQQVARITVFPACCVEALTCQSDFLHYSTELVPMALIAAGSFLFVRRFAAPSKPNWNYMGGFVLGAVPLAKLQAVPIALLIGLCWIIGEVLHLKRAPRMAAKPLLTLMAGAITPCFVCAILVIAAGLGAHVALSYLTQNIAYTGNLEAQLPGPHILFYFVDEGRKQTGLLFEWIAGGALWLLVSLSLPKTGGTFQRLVTGISGSALILSILCILLPHRPFLHYLHLVIVPWCFVLGSTTGLALSALESRPVTWRAGTLLLSFVLSGGGVLGARLAAPAPPTAHRLVTLDPDPQRAVANELVKYARPGEAMGLWGWMPQFYVEAELRQASRLPFGAIDGGPHQAYFRKLYLDDLRKTMPPVFVDATGPGNFWYYQRKDSFENTFPEFAAFIHDRYVLGGDVNGARIYVRLDRWEHGAPAIDNQKL